MSDNIYKFQEKNIFKYTKDLIEKKHDKRMQGAKIMSDLGQKFDYKIDYNSYLRNWTNLELLEWRDSNMYHLGNVEKIEKYLKSEEKDYYTFLEIEIKKFLRLKFGEDQKTAIENTSGKKSSEIGRWTRPDLVGFAKTSYPYIPGADLEVITFEIKRPEDINVIAVFEALAHRSAANLSYCVFPVSLQDLKKLDAVFERIIEECQKYGIGLIYVDNIYSSQSPELKCHIHARSEYADKARVSNFLRAVLTPEQLATLATAV